MLETPTGICQTHAVKIALITLAANKYLVTFAWLANHSLATGLISTTDADFQISCREPVLMFRKTMRGENQYAYSQVFALGFRLMMVIQSGMV
jgi:hypothetical protein